MVRRDVREDRHGRPPRQRRDLELRQFVDHAVVRGQLEQPLHHRDADVAAEDDRMGRIGRQDRRDQRGRRRLAFRPGDPDGRCGTETKEEVRLGHECGGRPVAAGSRIHERAQGRPQSGFGGREIGRDRGRGGHEVGACPGQRRLHLRAQRERQRAITECPDGVGEIRGRPSVVDGHACAGIREEAGQGQATPGETEDGDRPIAESAGPDRVEAETIEVDRAHHRDRPHRSRSSEARNSVTPRSAARIPTIQNRIVIFSSSQPASSK